MKKNTIKRIKEAFPHFNERPITENDFWRASKKFKIVVRRLPLEIDGYYERYKGRNYILLSERLTGRKWLHTALHEFCHFLFDVPIGKTNYVLYRKRSDIDRDDPRERWADAFATICLMPFPEIIRSSKEPPPEDQDTLRLCLDRLTVKSHYGI